MKKKNSEKEKEKTYTTGNRKKNKESSHIFNGEKNI